MRKVFRISWESKIRENYSIMTPNYGSFKAGDSTRSRFLMRHAPPCDQSRGVDTQCHADAWPGLGSVLPSYAFFLRGRTWFAPRLVSFRRGLSRAVTCSFYAVIFPRSRSCRLCWDRIWEPDCAVTRAQLNGADPLLIGLLQVQSHPPLIRFRALQPWVPN